MTTAEGPPHFRATEGPRCRARMTAERSEGTPKGLASARRRRGRGGALGRPRRVGHGDRRSPLVCLVG
jgi:hypothetical protein